MDTDALVAAIDKLESTLAAYFAEKDVPMEIRQAVDGLEQAMFDAGLSPLAPLR